VIRGVNKYIIEVTDTENKYFDKAILFLNREFSETAYQKIEKEAKKYISNIGSIPNKTGYLRKKRRLRKEVIVIGSILLIFGVLAVILALFINLS